MSSEDASSVRVAVELGYDHLMSDQVISLSQYPLHEDVIIMLCRQNAINSGVIGASLSEPIISDGWTMV